MPSNYRRLNYRRLGGFEPEQPGALSGLHPEQPGALSGFKAVEQLLGVIRLGVEVGLVRRRDLLVLGESVQSRLGPVLLDADLLLVLVEAEQEAGLPLDALALAGDVGPEGVEARLRLLHLDPGGVQVTISPSGPTSESHHATPLVTLSSRQTLPGRAVSDAGPTWQPARQ
ncbi:MAG: hypothetical protein WKF72_01225, partial [Nocardioidaceae bacterium]